MSMSKSEYISSISNTGNTKNMKRSASTDGDETNIKKNRYELSNEVSPSWKANESGSNVNSANNSQSQKQNFLQRDICGTIDTQDFNPKGITLNSAAPSSNDELIVIPKFEQSNCNDMLSSPIQSNSLTDEYILFESDVMDLVESDDCMAVNKEHSTDRAESNLLSYDLCSEYTQNKDVSTKLSTASNGKQSKSSISTKGGKQGSDQSNLSPQEPKKIIDSSLVKGTDTRTMNTANQHLQSDSHINFQNKSTITHRTNINSSLKQPPVLVTAKKLSEVTQTTAKVSIGNTTISVPLLKPLNAGRIQTSGGDNQKSVSSVQQQLNLSKILNVKGNPKLTKPTIVSLSQIQIKPVPTAKIVQAKIVSKKISAQITDAAPSHGTIEPATVMKEELEQKPIVSNHICKKSFSESQLDLLDDHFKHSNAEKGSTKKIITCSVNEVPPLISTYSKIGSQPISTSMCSPVNIIRRNVSSTSAGTLGSSQVILSDSKLPSDVCVQTNGATSGITNLTKSGSSSVITIPRNISLMLTKSGNNNSAKISSDTTNLNQSKQLTSMDQKNKINLTQTIVSSDPFSLANTPSKLISTQLVETTNSGNLLKLDSMRTEPTNQQILKGSKSSDENEKDLNVRVHVAKRNSAEYMTTIHSNDIHDNVGNCDVASDNLMEKAVLVKNNYSIACTPTTNTKSDETNNALLKQLLQNSPSPHSSTNIITTPINSGSSASCNQVISSRKVINVRAPSLGLVSSLEAQLARPVLPPVAASNTTIQSPKHFKCTKIKDCTQDMSTEIINDMKGKTNVQIITKETSFVSKPTTTNTINNNKHLESKPILSDTASVGNKLLNNVETGICQSFETAENRKSSIGNENKEADLVGDETIVSNLDNNLSSMTPIASVQNRDNDFQQQTEAVNREKLPKYCGKTKSAADGPKHIPHAQNSCKNNLEYRKPITTKLVSSIHSVSEKSSSLSGLSSEPNMCSTVKSAPIISSNGDNDNINHIYNKDTEIRKKRKRDYPKHRRQMISKTHTVSTNVPITTSTSRKRPRKLSKIDEDYDNYMDNLMSSIRQMQPLQVLEPLLNQSSNAKNLFGKSSHGQQNLHHKNILNGQFLLGDYGSGYHPHVRIYYSPESYAKNQCKNGSQTIHNNFYDQEFLPVLYRNEQCSLSQVVSSIRERGIDFDDILKYEKCLDNSKMQSAAAKYSHLNFPGLILFNCMKNNFGRVSPVIPLIDPLKIKNKNTVIQESQSIQNCEPTDEGNQHKLSQLYHKCNVDDNVIKKTVLLSLPLSAAGNILCVLKNLANLLQISTPTAYKVIKSSDFVIDHFSGDFCAGKKLTTQNKSLQFILNGRRRICRNCGSVITNIGIKTLKSSFASCHLNYETNLPDCLYFCSRICFSRHKRLHKNNSKFTVCKETSHFVKSNGHNVGIVNSCKKRKDTLKYFTSQCFPLHTSVRPSDEKELSQMLSNRGITISAYCSDSELSEKKNRLIEDTRQCVFCTDIGDGLANGPSRLLNFDVDKWVHLNCALWSSEVYETVSGALMNFSIALQAGLNQTCYACHLLGATLKCFKPRCGAIYHLPCAIKEKCVFYKNKTILCLQHSSRLDKENELQTLSVQRRVYVERDENLQIAAIMHNTESNNILRIGSLTFLNMGQLFPQHIEAFHTPQCIYPVGYKVIRLYWSTRRPHKRCRYICSIVESCGRPEFVVQIQEPMEPDIELRDSTPRGVLQKILNPIVALRKKYDLVQLFPQFISGEDLFGLTEPAIVRIIENLPGVEALTHYRFKYGRNPLLELPLAVNPSGAARTEAKQRQFLGWRKPHTQRTGSNVNQRLSTYSTSVMAGEAACPYSKQFVHSKSSQYKKMKQEWRNNVYLARSKIQGLGLYSARDMEKHTMIIEYIGEVIRTEVSEIREKQYEARNRGIYMFRLDEDRVVDATLSGGLARYINHSCNPNCVTEIVEVDRELRIIIFAKRRISRGEELSYDYKFDIEDDAHKISCMCGAPNCRKWMN